MADLEKIVRPFQLRVTGTALAEKVLGIRKAAIPVIHRSGANGKGKQIAGSFHGEFKLFHESEVVEISRK